MGKVFGMDFTSGFEAFKLGFDEVLNVAHQRMLEQGFVQTIPYSPKKRTRRKEKRARSQRAPRGRKIVL